MGGLDCCIPRQASGRKYTDTDDWWTWEHSTMGLGRKDSGRSGKRLHCLPTAPDVRNSMPTLESQEVWRWAWVSSFRKLSRWLRRNPDQEASSLPACLPVGP